MVTQLNLKGALISFNTSKGFEQVQKIDDVEDFSVAFGCPLPDKLESDLEAIEIALWLGYLVNPFTGEVLYCPE